jgi:hypothetical protein
MLLHWSWRKRSSETPVRTHQITLSHSSEDGNPMSHRHDNLRSCRMSTDNEQKIMTFMNGVIWQVFMEVRMKDLRLLVKSVSPIE